MEGLVINEESIRYKTRDKIRVGDFSIDVPAKYRGRALTILLPVSSKKIAEFINFPGLKPSEIIWGKSLLGVTLFDFSKSPVGPYTELVLSTPVLYKPNIGLPLFSLIRDDVLKRFNLFILNIYQSTKIAIEHGNLLTGYPHNSNLINVKFEDDEKNISINSYGDNKSILSLKINKPKKEKLIKESYMTYFIRDGSPYQIQMDIFGIAGRVELEKLSFGNHKISWLIKDLIISDKPFQIRYSRDVIEINPVAKNKL